MLDTFQNDYKTQEALLPSWFTAWYSNPPDCKSSIQASRSLLWTWWPSLFRPKRTWKKALVKMKSNYKPPIFGFHVSFRWCIILSSRHNSQTPRLLKIFQLPARHQILHMRWCWSCTRWCWHRSFFDLTQERIYLHIYDKVDVDMLCLQYII